MNDESIRQIFLDTHTIAVVGISPNPDKPSHDVPAYLQANGYRIIPVNPKLEAVLGEAAYPDLLAVPAPVDLVQIFRRSEFVPAIVEQAIEIGAKTVWMQVGIINEAAAQRAREACLQVVMDQCMRVQHLRLMGD